MPPRFSFLLLLAIPLAVLVPTSAAPHGGGLDTYGCHNDRKGGGYHCHQGKFAGQAFASKQDMLAALEKQRQEPLAQEPQAGPRPTDKNQTCISEKETGRIVCGDICIREKDTGKIVCGDLVPSVTR